MQETWRRFLSQWKVAAEVCRRLGKESCHSGRWQRRYAGHLGKSLVTVEGDSEGMQKPWGKDSRVNK